MKKYSKLLLFLSLFGAALPAYAAPCANPGEYALLAPIGVFTAGTCYSLTGYLAGILFTVVGIAGILAVIRIVICGIQLMASGSVSGKNEAKGCITDALIGVLLIIGSWLILNTINPLLLKDAALSAPTVSTVIPAAPNTPTTQPAPATTAKGCYFKYKDLTNNNIGFSSWDTCPVCDQNRTKFQADTTHYQILSECYKPSDPATPIPPASSPPPATTVAGSVTCNQSGLNLCAPQARVCTNANCNSQFAASAALYAASPPVTAAFIKALIVQESSCSQMMGFDGKSAGPIHLTPATANVFKSGCGVSTNITLGWLAEKANWDKSICIASKYLQSLTGPCGSSERSVAAGYNGGSGVCTTNSVSCSGDTSCAGGPVKIWECLWDDNAHKSCNTGLTSYETTRRYATQVMYCAAHPGY